MSEKIEIKKREKTLWIKKWFKKGRWKCEVQKKNWWKMWIKKTLMKKCEIQKKMGEKN